MRWYGRLGRSREIATVRRRGAVAAFPSLVAYGIAGGPNETRVAITVSKAVGKAVVRNVVRRRIRGALDGSAPLERGLRLVIVAKPGAGAVPYELIAGDVTQALLRLGAGSSYGR